MVGVNIITTLVTHLNLLHVKTSITTLPGLHLSEPCKLPRRKAFPTPSLHYGCTQEHHRLAQHTERRTRINRTGPETQ